MRQIIRSAETAFYYSRLRRPKRWGWLPSDETRIISELGNLGFPVRDVTVSIDQYKAYFEQAGYSVRYPKYYPNNIVEKSFEHFIAQQLLLLSPDDVYIDIASQGSPTPEIYHRLYGCRSFAQDLSYDPGLNGNRIGSDAASLPLGEGTISKMALHCSFEHFEGNSDSGFITEAARVLSVGGKFVIVPLYLAQLYAVATDLLVSRANRVCFEKDAIVMAVPDWGNRHGRFYDAAHLASRVLEVTKGLTFSIIRIVNNKQVDETVYARFALVGTRI